MSMGYASLKYENGPNTTNLTRQCTNCKLTKEIFYHDVYMDPQWDRFFCKECFEKQKWKDTNIWTCDIEGCQAGFLITDYEKHLREKHTIDQFIQTIIDNTHNIPD